MNVKIVPKIFSSPIERSRFRDYSVWHRNQITEIEVMRWLAYLMMVASMMLATVAVAIMANVAGFRLDV